MSQHAYPPEYEVIPFSSIPLQSVVSVPGSKSITNRALVLAALASDSMECQLTGLLDSEDTQVMLEALEKLGFAIQTDHTNATVTIRRVEAPLATDADLFVANSGTSMRFLTAMVATLPGRFRFDGIARMRERPIQDLLSALNQLGGVKAFSETENGCPPVVVESIGLQGGEVSIRADLSSQFLSALLMVAPFAQENVSISIDGKLVSEPYVEMTLAMMAHWGIAVDRPSANRFEIRAKQPIQNPAVYAIEPDASAASYFWAAAAIMGGTVTVLGLSRTSLQGDVEFVAALEQMGCQVTWEANSISVTGGKLHGIDIDMNAISDTVMSLAVVACFADGPTRIRNVAHIRHKETDRIAAVANELRRLGVEVEEREDGLTIHPRAMHGTALETYNDHRMAMSLALVGMRVSGVKIKNPGCVAKTYPGFWEDFEKLRSMPSH